MDTKQPEALRIAQERLRALHAENESLRERVQQLGQLARSVNSRRVMELEAQLEAIGAGGVEPLRKRECLHQISEPAQAGEYPELPSNFANALRRIGRCESERAAQVVLENAMRKYADAVCAARGAAQAAPVDATVQRDAARYRFLRDGEWRRTDLESVIRLQLNTLWDSKIDAAIDAQKGGRHG